MLTASPSDPESLSWARDFENGESVHFLPLLASSEVFTSTKCSPLKTISLAVTDLGKVMRRSAH